MPETADNPLGEYLVLLQRHGRLIATVAAAAVALTVVVTLVAPRRYSAGATFAPQRSELSRSGLAGLAAQFGVTLPAAETSESPAFYGRLLASASLLREVVEVPLPRPKGADSASLIEIWEVKGPRPEVRRERAVEQLRKAMVTRFDNELGIVDFTVRTKDPRLSEAIASQILQALNHFNLERRQSRASAERHFTEERRGQAQTELRAAERELEGFLESNRRYTDSPALMARRDRLMREVQFRQQVYNSLSQAYEQARLEEVRDTPVFTVVERPIVPARPDSRGMIGRASVALLVGLLLGLGVALASDHLPAVRQRLRRVA